LKLFLAPHPDDETLFGAFTLLREKPLVVIMTESFIQQNRGENITAEQRWQESVNAMKVLGCPLLRLGIRDDIIDKAIVREKLSRFWGFEEVYAPEIQLGNPHHDLIGQVAKEMFNCRMYATYTRGEWFTPSGKEIIPTENELLLKERALSCYTSQLQLKATAEHFNAVKGKSEWMA
jgi:LmbE family N-acetylglucosaminyl deacetylase